MGDPSVPDEQEDIQNILAQEDDSHGPGDLSAVGPGDLDQPDGTDVA